MWSDYNQSMGYHITKTSSVAFYYLYNIRRIRKYLSTECTYRNTDACLFSSRIDYCMPAIEITESSEFSCSSCIRRKQILSYYSYIKILALVTCKVSHRFFKVLLLAFKASTDLLRLTFQNLYLLNTPVVDIV